MTTTYTLDYADPDTGETIRVPGYKRTNAMAEARRVSRVICGSAYAIRVDDGREVGQQVYESGYYSHTDDTF